MTLFNLVLNKQQSRILVDAANDLQFASDPYIAAHKPKSVLCMPLLFRGNVVSVLYLENTLSKGVFSKSRLMMLRLVASQAVISIENARLYTQLARYNRTLEEKVAQRTTQLQEANQAKSMFIRTMSHEVGVFILMPPR